MSRSNYEFREEENTVFSGLVLHARLLGLVTTFAGALFLFHLCVEALLVYDRSLAFLPQVAVQSLGVLSALLMAAYLIDSSNSLKKVVTTEGNDIEHLLDGLLKFSRLFRDGTLIFWVMSVISIAVIVGQRFWGS